jgi:hypothetical protein
MLTGNSLFMAGKCEESGGVGEKGSKAVLKGVQGVWKKVILQEEGLNRIGFDRVGIFRISNLEV